MRSDWSARSYCFPFSVQHGEKDVEGALYQILPEWMFDMALLLQTNNVQVALAKSIESAETLLKQELMELVERITDDPENIQSYLMFFKVLMCRRLQHV